MPRPRKNLRCADYDRLEAVASVGVSMRTCAQRLGAAYGTLQEVLGRDKMTKEAVEAGCGERGA